MDVQQAPDVVTPEITPQQKESVLKPETISKPTTFAVGDKIVSVKPMKRIWQSMFFASAWPIVQARLRAPESILKSMLDKTFMYNSTVDTIVSSELTKDEHLDRAAAVILASQTIGAEADPSGAVNSAVIFVGIHSTTKELHALVDAQVAQEELVERVGEALPAGFLSLLNLAGVKGATTETAMQHLNSWLPKLRELTGNIN